MLGTFAHAATYYVDTQNPAATDSGPVTQAIPYRMISAAVSQHGGAGNTILVSPGVYREQVSIGASGASSNPFVVQASGAGAVIEGVDNFANTALWTPVSGNVWLATSVTWSMTQVFVDGQRCAIGVALSAPLAARHLSGQGTQEAPAPQAHRNQAAKQEHGVDARAALAFPVDVLQVEPQRELIER